MKKMAFTLTLFSVLLVTMSGCADKRASLGINGMICPEGHSEEEVKADFSACRYYNPEDAAKANAAPITIECKECLVKKGYKIGK
jgi:predicted component of type VI protein secretion system